MMRRMKLNIWLVSGSTFSKDIEYEGETAEEIESRIVKDREELEYWMRTGFDNGSECFNFAGFMLKKKSLAAMEITEADW